MLKIILRELFYILTFAIVVFSFLEFFWSKMVLSYINLSLVLIIWVIVGMINLYLKE